MKRFASHYLLVPDKGFLKQQVIEVEGEYITRIFSLTEELEDIEWMPGVIVLSREATFTTFEELLHPPHVAHYSEIDKNKAGKLYAHLLYPFNFTDMQPVAETQHKLLP